MHARHRGRRRTLAKSMPSRISVKSLNRISIPAGEAEPSSRTARAALWHFKGSAFQSLVPNH